MGLFGKKPLELKKIYDECVSGQARLVVVFVHGIASDATAFGSAIRFLAGTTSLKDIRFVAYDLLGWGKSQKSDTLKYNFTEQLTALHNSLDKLGLNGVPVVLVGHSMGTLIVARYADKYKKSVAELILLSPPIYREADLDAPAMAAGVKIFTDAVALKNRKVLEDRAFSKSLDNIVLDRKNYQTIAGLKTPAVLIYGDADQFIAPQNVRRVAKENPKYITAVSTLGGHGISREKYRKMVPILEEILNKN